MRKCVRSRPREEDSKCEALSSSSARSSWGRTLKDALEDDSLEYQNLSNLQVDLIYEWVDVDMDVMIEDTIFRVIQESMTNAVRHSHASLMELHFLRMKQITYGGCRTMEFG